MAPKKTSLFQENTEPKKGVKFLVGICIRRKYLKTIFLSLLACHRERERETSICQASPPPKKKEDQEKKFLGQFKPLYHAKGGCVTNL